jgi:conjugal transfer pilus assembly protein TraD
MNSFEDRFNQYISTHPKESLQLLTIGLCLFWISGVAILGLIVYFILSKIIKCDWWIILVLGAASALTMVLMSRYFNGIEPKLYLMSGFTLNKYFWKLIFTKTAFSALDYLWNYGNTYLIGFPLLLAGILSTIDQFKESPHKTTIDAIKKGEHYQEKKELPAKKINQALQRLSNDNANGVLLGVSTFTAKPIVMPDHYINQIILVLGTTGSGKTVTLQRFYQRAIRKGYPLIVIDGKPTQDNIDWLKNLAEKHDRQFYGFNCDSCAHYDPLSNGDCSELKDKIISLKDQWENDYYRSIAEDYLQTTFDVLLQSGTSFDLKKVASCLDFDTLKELCRSIKNGELLKRVESLKKYDLKDITGLQAHLNILIHSSMGEYFKIDDHTFTLEKIINDNAIVYFSLPALRYPSFSKVLGKLVINDIKATIERNETNKRVFMVFDEFSVFAGDQVLNLVNMGRGKGVHAVFGTQGIADLDTVNKNFKSQMLNCANTLICHRLNDQESAETVAGWIGTKDSFTVTAQYNAQDTDANLGSIRSDKTYVIHPESIKQRLGTGEAYYVSKVGNFGWEKVKVLWD